MDNTGLLTLCGFAAAGLTSGVWATVGLLTPELMVTLAVAGGTIGFVGDLLYLFAKE